MQRRTVLSDNDFPKYSRAHVAMSIMVAWRFLKQYRLRAWWSRAFSSGFRPWPLHTEIPLTPWIFSWYYELWMVKDLNSLQSCAEKHCLWTDWFSSQCLAQSGEPRPILACKQNRSNGRAGFCQSYKQNFSGIGSHLEWMKHFLKQAMYLCHN